ncbi:MAG TPA: ATP-binding protein [Actinomycetes bacterium]|jgi:PAS domain S-box-containing protein|nr:ATP-binding protein [Actinomycetes bacterium]
MCLQGGPGEPRAEVTGDKYLAALHETSLALREHMEASGLLEQIVARAAQVVGTSHGYICLIEPGTSEMVLRVGVGAFTAFVGLRMVKGEGLSGGVWERGAPVAVADYDAWIGRVQSIPRGLFHASLGVPLLSDGNVTGVIGLAFSEPGRRFSEAEVEQASRFGELASIALQNARMYAEAKQEVEEHKRTEERLRQAEARYRTLIEQIPAVVYTERFALGGGRVYLNRHIEPMLGYPSERAERPDFWSSVLHPDDRDQVLAEQTRCERTSEPFGMEYRVFHRHGHVVWVRDQCLMIRGDAGQPLFWQGVVFDVTETKRIEQATREALEREREAAQRLRSLDEMKNTFLDAVSHELRTPLAAVVGIALTLQRAGSSLAEADVGDLLARLVGNARKLDRLLTDLLDLDRLSRGIVAPKRRPTDVGKLVSRVAEEWRLLNERDLNIDAEQVVISLDPGKVERIVENLLANAARHTPRDSPVWVRVRRDGDGVQIAIEDAGAGVPPELRASVFEPFRQGPGTPTHAPGVGIGLSLVARFAELHGGRAWVDERSGGGSSFRVYIPDVPSPQGDGGRGP